MGMLLTVLSNTCTPQCAHLPPLPWGPRFWTRLLSRTLGLEALCQTSLLMLLGLPHFAPCPSPTALTWVPAPPTEAEHLHWAVLSAHSPHFVWALTPSSGRFCYPHSTQMPTLLAPPNGIRRGREPGSPTPPSFLFLGRGPGLPEGCDNRLCTVCIMNQN